MHRSTQLGCGKWPEPEMSRHRLYWKTVCEKSSHEHDTANDGRETSDCCHGGRTETAATVPSSHTQRFSPTDSEHVECCGGLKFRVPLTVMFNEKFKGYCRKLCTAEFYRCPNFMMIRQLCGRLKYSFKIALPHQTLPTILS